MSLWLRVRRTRICALTIVGVAVTLLLTRGWSLKLPNLLGGPILIIPIALLLPLALAIAVAAGLTTGDPAVEAVASRPLPLLDAGYALSTAALMLVTALLVQRIVPLEPALAAGRNAVGYIGLTLIGRRISGAQTAAILPVAFAVITALISSSEQGETHLWAWHIATAYDRLSWGIAGTLLLAGMGLTLMPNNAAITDR